MLDDLLNVVLYLILTYHVQSTQKTASYLLLHQNKKRIKVDYSLQFFFDNSKYRSNTAVI